MQRCYYVLTMIKAKLGDSEKETEQEDGPNTRYLVSKQRKRPNRGILHRVATPPNFHNDAPVEPFPVPAAPPGIRDDAELPPLGGAIRVGFAGRGATLRGRGGNVARVPTPPGNHDDAPAPPEAHHQNIPPLGGFRIGFAGRGATRGFYHTARGRGRGGLGDELPEA